MYKVDLTSQNMVLIKCLRMADAARRMFIEAGLDPADIVAICSQIRKAAHDAQSALQALEEGKEVVVWRTQSAPGKRGIGTNS